MLACSQKHSACWCESKSAHSRQTLKAQPSGSLERSGLIYEYSAPSLAAVGTMTVCVCILRVLLTKRFTVSSIGLRGCELKDNRPQVIICLLIRSPDRSLCKSSEETYGPDDGSSLEDQLTDFHRTTPPILARGPRPVKCIFYLVTGPLPDLFEIFFNICLMLSESLSKIDFTGFTNKEKVVAGLSKCHSFHGIKAWITNRCRRQAGI